MTREKALHFYEEREKPSVCYNRKWSKIFFHKTCFCFTLKFFSFQLIDYWLILEEVFLKNDFVFHCLLLCFTIYYLLI
jgi:hypothetical protein